MGVKTPPQNPINLKIAVKKNEGRFVLHSTAA